MTMTTPNNNLTQQQFFQLSQDFDDLRAAYVSMQLLTTSADVDASCCYHLLEVLNLRFEGLITDFDALRQEHLTNV